MTASFPSLTIETLPNGCLRLENESTHGDGYVVDVHPIHLRHMVETLGLVPTSDPNAWREIATMHRRMLVLLDRIAALDEMLGLCGSHEDLSAEQAYSGATWDIAREYCHDIVPVSAPYADKLQTSAGQARAEDATQLELLP